MTRLNSEIDTINRFLRQEAARFVANLDTSALIWPLLSADVLDEDQTTTLARLKRERPNRDLTEELWIMLRGKSLEQKIRFLRCVRQKQSFLVNSEEILALIREPVADQNGSRLVVAERETAELPPTCANLREQQRPSAIVGNSSTTSPRTPPLSRPVADDTPPLHRSTANPLHSKSAHSSNEFEERLKVLKRKPNRLEVIRLSKTNASMQWMEIADILPNLSSSKDQMAFNRAAIEAIERRHGSSEHSLSRCLKDVLYSWIDMSREHTLDVLYSILEECSLQDALRDVVEDVEAKN